MLRPDVTELHRFYSEPLGMATCRIIRKAIRTFWKNPSENRVQQIMGIGYAPPYLLPYKEQEKNRVAAVMPAGQGVMHWPRHTAENAALLSHETELPLHDQSIDKAIVIHALEFLDTELFLPELWRVLAPNGQALFIVPSRSGCWSRAEKTPFGHGRPYSAMQLERALKQALFIPVKTSYALYYPPIKSRFLLKLSPTIERIARALNLPFGGVVMVLAEKRLHAPIGGNKAPAFIPAGAKLANAGNISLDDNTA